jgi:hypothetical protein
VGDRPRLLRFAPQRKGDRASAEHLILPFSSEDVLELDVTEKYLCFGNETADRLMTVTAALDDDLVGSLLGLLRLGNGKWNLAFFLLRTSSRDGSRFLGWRGTLCIDQRGLNFISGTASRRTSSNDQGCQYEQA